jgi:hypothetical protein
MRRMNAPASWSAERQFRFGRESRAGKIEQGAFAQLCGGKTLTMF